MRDGAPQIPQPLTAHYEPFLSIRWFRREPPKTMKTTKQVETTITHELTVQDVLEWVTHAKMVPPEWKYFSVSVEGLGLSKGAKITVKNTEAKV